MEGKLNIKIKHMSDKPLEVEVTKDMTVAQVKDKIAGLINVPSGEQKLIHKGKILKDEDKVGDSMEEGSTIHAVIPIDADQEQSCKQHHHWNYWNCRRIRR